ncbi:hypothetical protein [Streptomyces sp. NPDC018833]|uniref:hypothetical protein n=1 Tax=Streptomyces sp. NPDC018833 TaxID=3365053 RepID=UPI003796EE24
MHESDHESTGLSTGADGLSTGADSGAPQPASTGPRGSARRLLSTVLPTVLVLGALGGGIVFIKTTVDGADTTAATQVWEEPADEPADDPAASASRGRTDTELSRTLLPVPEGFRLGPDIESYGNDSELGPRQAAALLKSAVRGISGKQRREYERQIDKLGVRGFAMRSYASDANDLVVEILVTRMKNKGRVHEMYENRIDLYESIGDMRKGPKIEGHRKAKCFLMPTFDEKGENDDERVDVEGMTCSAYDGDLLVTVNTSGSTPFDRSAAAGLVKDQLDHIGSPGEYV